MNELQKKNSSLYLRFKKFRLQDNGIKRMSCKKIPENLPSLPILDFEKSTELNPALASPHFLFQGYISGNVRIEGAKLKTNQSSDLYRLIYLLSAPLCV